MEPLRPEAPVIAEPTPITQPDATPVDARTRHRTAADFELIAGGDLPFTASALWAYAEETGEHPTPRLALPPRLRIDPDRPSVLSDWIDLAEQRYGFPVRAQETIDSW